LNRPKLLYFVTEDWYFSSHRLPLAVAAREAGFDVVVVTRVREHGGVIRRAGLSLIPFEMSRRGMNPFGELGALARLTALYRREKPDLVHHVAMKPVLYGTLAARLASVPRVVNALAGMGWLFTSTNLMARLLKPLVRLTFRILLRPTNVIVQNPDDAALMAGLGVGNVHLIRGAGVDTRIFHPAPSPAGDLVVMLASRMLWDKGVGEFVEAAGMLREMGASARFVLVGERDPANPSAIPESRLQEWEAKGIVEWWGKRDDMAEVIHQAHVVCLPSYREGLPKVLLEAAASGLPLVATDVPGCREIVRNEENGLLVPARDATALAAALRRLIEDRELRCRMGARGREIVETEFSVEKVVSETLAVYGELLP
jgi:glycosyltransferase involved in cell wall biosynthesis